MVINNLYTGITKDGIDRILLRVKKYISTNKYYEFYIDIQNNEVFLIKDISMDTLIPFKNICGNKIFMKKRKVVETYNFDRNSEIDVECLRFGNIYSYEFVNEMFKDDFVLTSNHKIFLMIGQNRYVNKNHLFVVDKDKEGNIVYIDLVTNKKYYRKNVVENNMNDYVANIKRLEKDFNIKGIRLSKRLILEMNYNKELY